MVPFQQNFMKILKAARIVGKDIFEVHRQLDQSNTISTLFERIQIHEWKEEDEEIIKEIIKEGAENEVD